MTKVRIMGKAMVSLVYRYLNLSIVDGIDIVSS